MREVGEKLTRWLAAALVLIVVAVATPAIALAAGTPSRIAVKIEGPKSQAVRQRVVAALPKGVTVIEEMKFVGALARAGLPGGRMAFSLTSPKMRPALLKIVKQAVKAEKLDGALIGRTGAGAGGFQLTLLFVEPDGDPPVDTVVPLKGGNAAQVAAVKEAVAPAFAAATAAAPKPEPTTEPSAAPAPTPADEGPAEPDEAPPEPGGEEPAEEGDEEGDYVPNRPGSELLSLQLSFQLNGRFFAYSGTAPGATNVRDYDTFGAPGGYAALELYPAVTSGVPVLRDFGLTAAYGHTFGWQSHTDDDLVQFATTWNHLWAGLVYRFRAGDADDLPVVINLRSRFGYWNFDLEPDNPAAELVMDEVATVRYLLLGGGLDARIPIGSHFALLPAFGVYGPLDGGEVYDRFTDSSLFILNAELAFAVVFDLGFEMRAGAEYLGALSSFDTQPTDPYVADGAADHYLALRLGLAYLY